MKTVLFCGGLGTRIRDYSESIPKPMIPIADKPILWHLMNYYSQYGHKDFVLCLGYRANVIKEFFLNYRAQTYADCIVSGYGADIEILRDPQKDWRVAMIDTGIWRNIGERLWSVREHVASEEMFLANYSDGLADVNLSEMIETFRKSEKVACFLAVRPTFSMHLVDVNADGRVGRIRSSQNANLWINGGFFVFRRAIFDYMSEGEELVEAPFRRLIEADQLLAFKHEGFWRPMDTLKDKQVLEDLAEHGTIPWQLSEDFLDGFTEHYEEGGMKALGLAKAGAQLSVLCLGAHSDDIEIGAGATILGWIERGVHLEVHWAVLSATGQRFDEAHASASSFLAGACGATVDLAAFKDGYFPYQGSEIKNWFEALKFKMRAPPDIILSHSRNDAHQDHREVSRLTWDTFRDHLILEYEIPKWDGDFGQPNVYIPATKTAMARKIELLLERFGSQRSKDWFAAETFMALAHLRGNECRASDGLAEAFHVRKLTFR